jgi:hypothetical protein
MLLAYMYVFLCRTGSICFLIHKYGYRVDKSLMISWFKASYQALRRYFYFQRFIVAMLNRTTYSALVSVILCLLVSKYFCCSDI